MSTFHDLAEGYRQVYAVDATDVIQAVDQPTSDNVWRQEGLFLRRLTSPVAFSNYLLVGDEDGYVHVLAQSDGRFVGRRKIGGKGLRSRPVVVDGTVYLLTNSGSLQALTVEMR
jgi:outer membrane protein assembly factor BamB